MKRINPKTNTEYKRGDFNNETSMYFYKYDKEKKDKDGYFRLHWLHEKTFNRAVNAINKARKNAQLKKNEGKLKGRKRLNTRTKKPFIYGEIERGKYFIYYDLRYTDPEGFFHEWWVDFDTYHKRRISDRLTTLRGSCKRRKIDINLDLDYLINIFPNNYKCPVLGIKMIWGGKIKNKGGPSMESPSVDRIIPNKGYVKGNVTWMSMRANYIKQDASSKELSLVASWLKKKGL